MIGYYAPHPHKQYLSFPTTYITDGTYMVQITTLPNSRDQYDAIPLRITNLKQETWVIQPGGGELSSTATVVWSGCGIASRKWECRRICRILETHQHPVHRPNRKRHNRKILTYGWRGGYWTTAGPLKILGSYVGEIGDVFKELTCPSWSWNWG